MKLQKHRITGRLFFIYELNASLKALTFSYKKPNAKFQKKPAKIFEKSRENF